MPFKALGDFGGLFCEYGEGREGGKRGRGSIYGLEKDDGVFSTWA